MYGPHVNRDRAPKAGIEAAIAHAKEQALRDGRGFEMRAAQIFVSSPRQWNILLDDSAAASLRQYISESNVAVVAHNTYAAPPWLPKSGGARKFIAAQLGACAMGGIGGFVVHLPEAKMSPADIWDRMRAVRNYAAKKGGDDDADSIVENSIGGDAGVGPAVCECADSSSGEDEAATGGGQQSNGGAALSSESVTIYLETPAVTPAKNKYATPAQLAPIFGDRYDEELNIGFCIDTAHLWVGGVDLSRREGAEEWIRQYRERMPEVPTMFHLNDSALVLGTGPDKHEALGRGFIWKDTAESDDCGLAPFVEWINDIDAVAILERKPDAALPGDYNLIAKFGK